MTNSPPSRKKGVAIITALNDVQRHAGEMYAWATGHMIPSSSDIQKFEPGPFNHDHSSPHRIEFNIENKSVPVFFVTPNK